MSAWLRWARGVSSAAALLMLLLGAAATGSREARAAAPTCGVQYTVSSDWRTGFTAGITISNSGPPLSSWVLGFKFPSNQQVVQGWNGTWSQTGREVTVTNAAWNGGIATGGTANIGANFSYSGSNTSPTLFTLNGMVCRAPALPPAVTLTRPTAGQVFTAGSAMPLSATATANPSTTIKRVEFYRGTVLLARSTTAPYTASWVHVPAGRYTITAWAYDALGHRATSAPVAITVTPAPGIVANPTTLAVTQRTAGAFGVSMSVAPASPVTVSVARGAGGNAGLRVAAGGTLNFSPSNWSTPQTVTIAADTSSTGSATFVATARGYAPASVTVTEIAPTAHVANPFAGATPYVNPEYRAEAQRQAALAPGTLATQMRRVGSYPTAVWVVRISAISEVRHHLDAALAQKRGGTPVAAVFVIYDLPDRDCASLASSGELPASQDGLAAYKSRYIDSIAAIFSDPRYRGIRIVTVVEPDSLPNLVTNLSIPNCAQANSSGVYVQGIRYALARFHQIPNVYSYLDIAHSGWLGWPPNMTQAARLYASVVRGAANGDMSVVDGFISDTANYIPTQEPFLPNPQRLVGWQPLDTATFYQSNPYFDEVGYDRAMYQALVRDGFPSRIGMLIDTSRNGWGGPRRPARLDSNPTNVNDYVNANRVDRRAHRGLWCNPNGAGIGEPPRAAPLGASSPIKAYVWIKPPGESDGTSNPGLTAHPDSMCDPGHMTPYGVPTGALSDAPAAGQWFPQQFQMLIQNAYPTIP